MSRINLHTVRRAAYGRWPDILTALGIPAAVLTKKNKPCPCCGGTDRFSFIDQGTGRFVCRSLDGLGGDGFALAMHWLGCDFKTALRAVAGMLGMGAGVTHLRTPVPAAPPAPAKRDNSATIAKLWAEAHPLKAGDPVTRYLASRGLVLDAIPAVLRCHPALGYWREGQRLGTFSALLAQVTSPSGEVVGLHRIYLTPDGHKARPTDPETGELLDAKKLLTAREGAMRGAAIRLYEPRNGEMAVCEGPETALGVWLGSGLPVWSCVSAWGLEHVSLPESVTDIHIMADNDVSGTGQQAAKKLAKRLLDEARRIRLLIPSTPGTDWLDVYQSRQQQEAA
ncbi:toprim domain-containing protein [Crenobacter sp. SG2303]|uniref:Toprim domain-containing protein n=1 Tax=Crenobacter oryzisoli TaxID=3056844 RepID=A0ABT7XJR7_9NEIS|nr:toprim domain-containing protein [Crenobacter sp. SG2303]MDN0074022.1 toprim domain-containing protein [Crenobacter sp. SG2303]